MTSKALLFALCAGVSQFAFADLAVAQDKTD
ncbi:MAG: hypothetical protein ACOVOE_03280, partial [Caulobacter sp.]